ncbi:hypothetical protein PENTCL1PPCAC_873, partial [Pristionchus entomophagus]
MYSDGERSIFRIPIEVKNCDMKSGRRKEQAFELYMNEVDAVEPRVKKIIERGLRKKYGSTFENNFKTERHYPKDTTSIDDSETTLLRQAFMLN